MAQGNPVRLYGLLKPYAFCLSPSGYRVEMVSQRQRLARKRYKEAHPDLFPKPEPTLPKDPDKKKKSKKTSVFKRKKPIPGSESLDSNKRPVKKGPKKHPLRLPGMKPGEGCYICKAKDHIAKLCPQKSEWEKNKICLLCRKRGHSLRNCPDKNDESLDKKLCYNCGESTHSLAKCPYPLQDGGTNFASCFICNERGHLSKNCPQNTHGIYPKGGCCKLCGSVAHLVKDCPNKGNKYSAQTYDNETRKDVGPRGQATKFVSGDDLEDDFMLEDRNNTKKVKSSEPKTKQGPKVIDFVG